MILFFNDVSGSELLVILVFILIFFGSKSIPGIAQTFGRTIRQIKDASNELQEEIRKSGVDVKKELNLKQLMQDSTVEIARPLDQLAHELNDSVRYDPPKINEEIMVNSDTVPNTDQDIPKDLSNASDLTLLVKKDHLSPTEIPNTREEI
jgi:sec-independent protein translocase protein TatA